MAITTPQFPPPVEMTNDTKKAVIEGVKRTVEILQEAGRLPAEISYSSMIHDPRDLYRYLKTVRSSIELLADAIKDKDGNPVTSEEGVLQCDITVGQVQQLLVKTCARKFLEENNREEQKVITEQVKTKVLGGLFTKTETVSRKTGSGFDERKVRDLSKQMAFDWQLPLLPAYNLLNTQHIFELGDDLACLQSFDAIREYMALDQVTLKRARAICGEDFGRVLMIRPAAMAGIAEWPKEMYLYFRKILGDAAWEFFARDKTYFMVAASLDKPHIQIYGDVLAYIDGACLEEMQRLNIDKTDVLLSGMRSAFGTNLKDALSNPAFAKEILRKLVESLQHVEQEKAQLAQSALITCKAMAPQVADWVKKQKAAARG